MPQTAGSQRDGYYREVDGIRSLAVLLVVLFHLNIHGFGGGFVGVDVFFVISGYLITKIILEELSASGGRFDYSGFFIRRAKRIFPALYVTLMASFCLAALVVRPKDLEDFSGSILSALTGLSNVFFWLQSGYFDVGAGQKPALHTWSLSVEAQFYLIWPIVMVWLVHRFSRVGQLIGILAISSSSLALNFLITDTTSVAMLLGRYISEGFKNREATIFFLMPFRVFEFGLGAVLLWIKTPTEGRRWSSEIVVALGCALILYAGSQFNVGFVYPSYHALVPCLGAALLLCGAKSSRFIGGILRSRIAVGLGIISYSLYLVHWPVSVFYRYVYPDDWSTWEKLGVFGASVVIATGLYLFVEKPFRRISVRSLKAPNRIFWTSLATLLAVIVLPTAHAFTHNGWQWRYPVVVADLLSRTTKMANVHKIRAPGCEFSNFKDFDARACVYPEPGRINILLLGDSVASFIWVGLRQNLPENRYNILQLTPSNCRPGLGWGVDYCRQSNDFIFDFIARNDIDLTVIASLGPDHSNLRKTLAYLRSLNRQVLVIGQPFIFNGRLPDIVASVANTATTLVQIEAIARSGLVDTGEARRQIETIAKEEGAEYFDIQSKLCSAVDDISTCSFVIDGGLITADNNHLTPAAAIKIFRGLASTIEASHP
ncbi:acyltransferase family protein [Bradyrhizobium sp.]|uniref:acyltransferase family protein n=1 Tax=Bradyrhizobium sp. TaxID=376 RepID=UPI001EC83380|nr:acyltransferase family protein [Bradyrhizobium sp.]MBV8891184.1 acyltransferase [Acidobacteriota bacterium]MBV9484226.1 acyltransferase [Acidobacteriota bacterium]MBV9985909.1 acyltransferase [Bradyrhizobium sp.]